MNENPPAPRRGKSCLIIGLVVLLLAGIGVGVAWWWHNRPIKPVVLTTAEKQVVEEKVEAIQAPEPVEPAEPVYEKGSREIVLTERELNGLLHENTGLGESVSFQLAKGAVHARIETDLDPEIPVLGGRKLKLRARFLVEDSTGNPALALDDLTVWGISLPNDWLGGIKGQDLLGSALGGGISGVEEFKVENGRLLIRLKE